MRLLCWGAMGSRASDTIATDLSNFEFLKYAREHYFRDVIITHSEELHPQDYRKWLQAGGKITLKSDIRDLL